MAGDKYISCTWWTCDEVSIEFGTVGRWERRLQKEELSKFRKPRFEVSVQVP